jgi:hypothetical protein
MANVFSSPSLKPHQWHNGLAFWPRERVYHETIIASDSIYICNIILLLMGKINKFFYGYISFLVSLVYDV